MPDSAVRFLNGIQESLACNMLQVYVHFASGRHVSKTICTSLSACINEVFDLDTHPSQTAVYKHQQMDLVSLDLASPFVEDE